MGKVYASYKPSRSKFGVKTDSKGKRERTRDGIQFASKREMERYQELKLLEKAGQVTALVLQPAFTLQAGQAEIGIYRADFVYFDVRLQRSIWEDVKGFKTPLYKWKRRHVEAQYGITIKET